MASLSLAPRSQEPRRQDLERRFLANTLAINGREISKQHTRGMRKLFSQHKKSFPTEQARRSNDMARRRAVEHLMRTRVKAGAEEDGEDVKWRAIANVKQDKWGEREEEHRAWIIAELEKRVDRQFSVPAQRLDPRARKAERRLLADTLDMPNRGGIPADQVACLQQIFKSNPWLETVDARLADMAAREHGVNYIAACRREAGVCQDLEQSRMHKGFAFHKMDTSCTKAELEQKERGRIPGVAADNEPAIDLDSSEDEEDWGDVLISAQRKQEPDLTHGEWEDDNFPEPIGDDDYEPMRPEPVSGGEEEE